jgi:xylan 1,4-beta-xylosidase
MIRLSVLLAFAGLLVSCGERTADVGKKNNIICNPIDISYRFCMDEPSRREAADPTVILHDGKYFLFASKSGGYWHSDDLVRWTFVPTNEIPVEEYAPTVVSIEDTLYFLASSNSKSTIYKTNDPLSGHWEIAVDSLETPVWDPAFHYDDDKKLYLYWGCSNVNPLYGVEVDYRNGFRFKGEPQKLLYPDPAHNGWEVPGDYNTRKETSPWIEGAWMTKYNGKYYLQYAGPGTEFKSYSDAVYVSNKPLGPYTLAAHNPFAYKPEGFFGGAGHGSTFKDKYGNYWHIGTATISVKHMFERRLALYPAFFDDDGILYANTTFGDYPMIIPDRKINSPEEVYSGLMLLSRNKKCEVSSSIDTLPATLMSDEDIRTYWSAKSGNDNEWAIIDLGEVKKVHGVQVNFSEHGTAILGRKSWIVHQYLIEISYDKAEWKTVVDRSKNETDNTHNYFPIEGGVQARYIRVVNRRVPGGTFAISDLRVFGHGNKEKPNGVAGLTAQRDDQDKRSVKIRWKTTPHATGYNIRFGTGPKKLYNTYTVYGDSTVTINTLNSRLPYYFGVEAFNENGTSALSEE